MSNLPFLRKKQYNSGGLTTEYTGPEQPEEQPPEADQDAALRHCAAALIHCVSAGDTEGVARALKEAHEICDMEPHQEAPHDNQSE